MINSVTLIKQLNLAPHPEGGYFRKTYISDELINKNHLPERFAGDRAFSTAIYFLLEQGDFSAFHRICSDECWHFYTGGTLNIYVIHQDGKLETIQLGNDINRGEVFQHVVPAGAWFASEPASGTGFSLVGCTVSPGFDFNDFEMAKAENLLSKYPEHAVLIERLCR